MNTATSDNAHTQLVYGSRDYSVCNTVAEWEKVVGATLL